MQLTVTELMTQPPLIVREDANIYDAVKLLLDDYAPQLDVVDACGNLLGSVPDYELLKAQMAGQGDVPVTRVMSSSAVRIDAESTTDFAAAVFRDGRYQRLPVVESGQVVGQIDRRDVMRLLDANSKADDTSIDDGLPEASASEIRAPRFADNRREIRTMTVED